MDRSRAGSGADRIASAPATSIALHARLAQRVEDGRLLTPIVRMLKAKVVLSDGAKVVTEEGGPQGGPLFPLLSNIVLDGLFDVPFDG